MRWKARKSDEERIKAAKALGWTVWFSWHPVRVNDGTGDWIWLETIERRVTERSHADSGYSGLVIWYEYRMPRKEGIWTRVNCDPRDFMDEDRQR